MLHSYGRPAATATRRTLSRNLRRATREAGGYTRDLSIMAWRAEGKFPLFDVVVREIRASTRAYVFGRDVGREDWPPRATSLATVAPPLSHVIRSAPSSDITFPYFVTVLSPSFPIETTIRFDATNGVKEERDGLWNLNGSVANGI